jgi:hypothetical protein
LTERRWVFSSWLRPADIAPPFRSSRRGRCRLASGQWPRNFGPQRHRRDRISSRHIPAGGDLAFCRHEMHAQVNKQNEMKLAAKRAASPVVRCLSRDSY